MEKEEAVEQVRSCSGGTDLWGWAANESLRPDSHFDTLAGIATGGFCDAMAALEGGSCWAMPSPDWCERPLAEHFEGYAWYETLSFDRRGALTVSPLRSLLGAGKPKERPAVVINRWIGPYLCRPLFMGADVVVEDLRQWVDAESLPEPWASCGELPCWVLVARSQELMKTLGFKGFSASWRGPVASARTLSLRSQRRSDTALAVAHFLAAHPRIAWVSYPGLGDDASNAVARTVLEHGFGPLVSFALDRGEGLAPVPDASTGDRSALRCGEAPGSWVFRAGLENPLDCVNALERWLACH